MGGTGAGKKRREGEEVAGSSRAVRDQREDFGN